MFWCKHQLGCMQQLREPVKIWKKICRKYEYYLRYGTDSFGHWWGEEGWYLGGTAGKLVRRWGWGMEREGQMSQPSHILTRLAELQIYCINRIITHKTHISNFLLGCSYQYGKFLHGKLKYSGWTMTSWSDWCLLSRAIHKPCVATGIHLIPIRAFHIYPFCI